MTIKPSYEELEQRVKELEKEKIERKQEDEREQFESTRLMSILDTLPGGVYIVSQQCDIEYINPVIRREFGPIDGRKCYTYFHDRTEICPWCQNAEVFIGKSVKWEWYSIKNNRHYDLFDTPFKNADGSISKFEIFHDITDRKRAEEALRQSEQRFRVLFENAPLGYQSLDENGNFIECNETWCRMLGYSKEEVLGRNFSVFIHPDFREVFKENFPKFKSMGYILGVEFEMIKKDGSEIVVAFDGKIGHKMDGSFRQTHCVFQDITDRKQAEETLQREKLLAEEYINSLPGLFYVFDEEQFVKWNKTWEIITGYSSQEVGERYGTDFFEGSDKDLIADRMMAVFSEGFAEAEADLVTKNGQRIPYYFTGLRKALNGKDHLIGLGIDITNRRQLEEQLRQASKMKSIGTLTGGIAHDFNNILGIIIGNTELSLEDIPEWNPAHASLKEIKTASLRASGIVKQLLNFSRKTDENLKLIGAVTIIKSAVTFLRSMIPTTIEMHQHLPDMDVSILADPIQINQVLMNIFTNASQAMEETGGLLNIVVEVTTIVAENIKNYPDLAPGEYVKITISDTGPGIDPTVIDRIFDPYFTTKETGKGSGLGLSVVLGIVKNHTGAITVDSPPGKGATFTILFPVVNEEPEIETETANEVPHGTETILFVDDEESLLAMTRKMLERLGYKVEARMNPVEAFDLFQSNPARFDLVITDMTMPQMTGTDLSKKLLAVRPDIPVIICTGHSSLIDEEKAKELGIIAYVMKPIVTQEIATTIRQALDQEA